MPPETGKWMRYSSGFGPAGWELAEVGVVSLSRTALLLRCCKTSRLTPSCFLVVYFIVELMNLHFKKKSAVSILNCQYEEYFFTWRNSTWSWCRLNKNQSLAVGLVGSSVSP